MLDRDGVNPLEEFEAVLAIPFCDGECAMVVFAVAIKRHEPPHVRVWSLRHPIVNSHGPCLHW